MKLFTQLLFIFSTLLTHSFANSPHSITANGTSFNPNDIKKSKLSDNDKDAPHGQGGYFFFNSGFGIQLVSIPKDDTHDEDAPSPHKYSAIGSLGLGYTHRFENNVIFGGELEFGFPIWQPKILLGYMLNDNNQISAALGYNVMPRMLLNDKSTQHLSLSSGLGIELNFQHFFTNGMFLRASLQAEYYHNAPDDLQKAIKDGTKEIRSFNATIWDIHIGLAYGLQW